MGLIDQCDQGEPNAQEVHGVLNEGVNPNCTDPENFGETVSEYSDASLAVRSSPSTKARNASLVGPRRPYSLPPSLCSRSRDTAAGAM